MFERIRLSFRGLLVIVVLLGAALACHSIDPNFDKAEQAAQEAEEAAQEAEHAEQSGAPANPQGESNEQPGIIGTVHAIEEPQAMFLQSDCPQDFPGLTARYGPGSLSCRYHWEGDFGANNMELRITEHKDAAAYQSHLDPDLAYERTAVDSIRSSVRPNNGTVEVIADSATEFIYMHTYDSTPTADDPSSGLCGEGWGTVGVNQKFTVELRVSDVCGLSGIAADYNRAIMTLREGALAAIARAEAAKQP